MIKFTRVSIADMLDVCGGGLLYDRMVDCVALVGEKMSCSGSYTGGYPLFSKNFSFEKFNTFFPNFENKKKICHKYVQKRKVDPICQKCLSDYILSIGE